MNWTQLPNVITSIRLLLLIPLSFFLVAENYQSALIIFFIAGVSDALDGFLAKRYNWVSRFGSILDPIADKALLVITMAILTLNQKISGLLFACVAIRDIYIITGAYFYYKQIGPFNMQPSLISKFNTFAQILMVTLILVSLGYRQISEPVISSLVFLVYLTVISSTLHYSFVWWRKYLTARKSVNQKDK